MGREGEDRNHWTGAAIPSLRIALIYVVVAGLWILFSGRLTSAIAPGREELAVLELYKGWFFVVVTGVLLFLLIYRQVAALQAEARRAGSSEARFQRLFQTQLIGLVLVDETSGVISDANRGFERLLGYKPEDLPLPWTTLIQESAQAREAELWVEAAEKGKIKRRERVLIRKNGRKVPVLIGGLALDGDRERQSLLMLVDIREQKRAEHELRKLLRELEERVAERTAELETAMIRAQSADRLKSVFLSTMSHELRTPLNSIIGFTGLLKRGLAGPVNEEQDKQLGMIQDSAQHLLELINDVLDISKIEAGQLDLFMETVEIPAVVEKVINMCRPQAESKGLTLRGSVGSTPPMELDRRRLEQILLNLLSNAVKFTDHGTVELTVSADGKTVQFEVRDTGCGIAEENLDAIFDPFIQAENGSTRSHEGTGLGLSITRKLAEAMGGKVTVASKLGAGSVFRVEFSGRTCHPEGISG